MCADRSACRRCSASVAWSIAPPPSPREKRLPSRYSSCTSRSRPWSSTRTCAPASARLTTRGRPKIVRKPSRRAVTRKRLPITATRYAALTSRDGRRRALLLLSGSPGWRRPHPPAAGGARSSGRHQRRVARLVDRLVELRAVQLGVPATTGQQLRVRAALDDPAPPPHEDQVRGADRGQPVRDHDRGAPLQRLGEGLLHSGFRRRVE